MSAVKFEAALKPPIIFSVLWLEGWVEIYVSLSLAWLDLLPEKIRIWQLKHCQVIVLFDRVP